MKASGPTTQVQQRGGGQQVGYTIDDGALDKIMGLLSSIYSDPVLAVLREYSTNAWDAHVAAGTNEPIEVIIGSALNPYFTVRDKGTGLTKDEALRLFGQYGATTKDSSNDYVGSFGIGSKSALALSDTMTVIARKNGQQVTIVVGRNEFGRGTLTVVGEGQTFDPDGVEITVPIRSEQVAEFHKHASFFFRFWNPGDVLINGAEPQHVEGQSIADGSMSVVDFDELQYDVVVMGGVPYRIDASYSPWAKARPYDHRRQRVVVWAEIGDVDLAPSREDLQYTDKTRKFLNERFDTFKSHLAKDAAKAVAAAKTGAEAFILATEWRGGYLPNNAVFKWRGHEVPLQLALETRYSYQTYQDIPDAGYYWVEFRPNSYGRKCEAGHVLTDYQNRKLRQIIDGKAVWITGYDSRRLNDKGRLGIKALTATNRDKVLEYARQQGMENVEVFYLSESRPFSPWLDFVTTWDWEDIRKIKLAPRATVGTFGPLGIDYYKSNGYKANVKNLTDLPTPSSGIVVLLSPGDWRTDDDHRRIRRTVEKYGDEYLFVSLGKNRWDKFKREYSGTILEIKEWAKRLVEDHTPSNDALIRWEAFNHYSTHAAPDGVDDPMLVRYNEIVRTSTEELEAVRTAAVRFGVYPDWKATGPDVDIQSRVNARYPLFQHIAGTKHHDHIVTYLNAIYANVKGESNG